MPNLYIISGCNGAGRTTASFTVLPEILNCQEFINADEIARGLSPFNPGKAAIRAGRIMLSRIDEFIDMEHDFAFETTLSTKSYLHTIKKAKRKGYEITLLFFWLDSVDLAIERVKTWCQKVGTISQKTLFEEGIFQGLKIYFIFTYLFLTIG